MNQQQLMSQQQHNDFVDQALHVQTLTTSGGNVSNNPIITEDSPAFA